jgi:hypothetical protein
MKLEQDIDPSDEERSERNNFRVYALHTDFGGEARAWHSVTK